MDQAIGSRPGEEIDVARLTPWLRQAVDLPKGAEVQILQFPGGHSNLTYLLQAGSRQLVLRRPPYGTRVKTAHDMSREFRVLSRLAPVWPRAPRPLAYCEDESVLGAPFYVMERVAGIILRREPPPDLALDEALVGRISQSFVATLAELHGLDYQAAGLGDFAHPEGYLSRQVSGWSRRYADARTDDIPAMEAVAGWLAERLPGSGPAVVIHNDYKHDNLVLDPADPSRIIAVLDWEMATIGDPLADLGTTLSYWVEAGDPPPLQAVRFGPTTLPGTPSRRQLVEAYGRASGRDVSNMVWYYVYGLFKAAVVGQQIYYRYQKGLTQDPRFSALIHLVRLVAEQADQARRRDDLA
jgi:aminoglycoside phosphotransferase (APT) family kinase protein